MSQGMCGRYIQREGMRQFSIRWVVTANSMDRNREAKKYLQQACHFTGIPGKNPISFEFKLLRYLPGIPVNHRLPAKVPSQANIFLILTNVYTGVGYEANWNYWQWIWAEGMANNLLRTETPKRCGGLGRYLDRIRVVTRAIKNLSQLWLQRKGKFPTEVS